MNIFTFAVTKTVYIPLELETSFLYTDIRIRSQVLYKRTIGQNLRKGKGIHQQGILFSCLSLQIVHHILQCIEVLDIPPLYIHNSLQQIALIHLWSSMLLIIHKTNQTYIARATNLRLFLLGTIKSVLKIYSNLLHNYLDFKLNIYFNTIVAFMLSSSPKPCGCHCPSNLSAKFGRR